MLEIVINEAHRDRNAGRHKERKDYTWDQNLCEGVRVSRGKGHQSVHNSCYDQDPLSVEAIRHVAH